MAKALKPPRGAPPYVYNPKNGRVMVATPAKLEREDLVPCWSLDGPGAPEVSAGSGEGSEPVITDTPAADAQQEVKGPDDFRAAVEAASRDELVALCDQMDIHTTHNMKPETMRERLLAAAEGDEG